MAIEVLLRKLTYLRQLLRDLVPYENVTLAEIEADHYKLERLMELLVMTASDILHHLLAERGITPTSYRDAFKKGADEGLLPRELAHRLEEASGMLNVLLCMYESIDLTILHASVKPALHDFTQFVALFEDGLGDGV